MKKVYFVRHGETTHNAQNLVQDHSPLLTQKGMEQATQVATRLRNLSFETLFASDYERTKQTAAVVTAMVGIEPMYSELFREIRRPSVFFHQPRNEGFSEFIKEETKQYAITEHWKHSDEESFFEVQERIKKAFELLDSYEGDSVVITHGHLIRRIVATVAMNFELTGPVWQRMYHSFHATNTGITTVIQEPGSYHWRLLTFNDHAHFADN